MQLFVKQVSKHFSPYLVLGLRSSLIFMLASVLMKRAKVSLHVPDPALFRLLVKRAIVSMLTVCLFLGSIKNLPLGVANTLFNTGPIMTIFVENIIFKKVNAHLCRKEFTGYTLLSL